ncbi:MAG: outer membrane protein transport protein [Burkholderiales bacterium]|nr:outer membrane protein transport protein [Burkholderiales bacterium]
MIAALSGPVLAGGMMSYELGTADVGLASAGYGARAQDASTVYTNPAGMARLEGNQFLGSGQLLWSNTKFSIGSGTTPGLGGNDGGYAVGHEGWFPGGGLFASYTLSPDVKLGFAVGGTFGGALNYDNDWVGRYYVQQTWLVGASLLPSIAWKVTDKLSLGASLNAMLGIYKNNVAINNVDPRMGDGRLKMKDETWGWGANLGLLYEFTPATRLGLTWGSQVDLDFNAPLEFSGLAPGISAALGKAGLLGSSLAVGIKVPQQAMASLFTQVDARWALLGSVGWQQWSKFGQIQVGIDDSLNPTSITTSIPFQDTWHVAAGAQYRLSEPWLLNFGVAYDSGYQKNDDQISPLLPSNAAWRFGVGGQKDLGKGSFWGMSAEYLYGGSLGTNIQGKPVALGGRGNLVGSYPSTGIIFLGAYYSRSF